MLSKKIIIGMFLFLLPSFSFGLEHDDDVAFWAGYEQQFGALQGKFLTYGGGTAGISMYGISVGASVHGSYNTVPDVAPSLKVIYGGVVLGYKSPEFDDVRIRANLTLGYGTIETAIEKTGHFVVAPTVYLDIELFNDINMNLGLSYRYFHDYTGSLNINKADNSFAGTIGFAFIQ